MQLYQLLIKYRKVEIFMKKLNKNGFTLVELLAVIVILALLIVIVANTAIPAMNNAKKKALQTYAQINNA